MAEETTPEGETKEEDTESSPKDKIAVATALVERMEAATKALTEQNDRAEAMKVQDTLGGTSEAGAVPDKPKEETPQEYAARVMSGDAGTSS